MLKSVQPETRHRLRLYHDLLLKWQKAVNLVSPATIADAWNRHFEDSLQLVELIPDTARVLVDLGSGAGFPGLVIAIARPDLDVHLVESDQKKGVFLLTVSRETGVQNVNLHNERIESVLKTLRVDVVTARALAPLDVLLGYTRPLWAQNPRVTLLFPKGGGWQKEVELAKVGHDFDLVVIPSKTAKDAAILCITGVREKKIA